jgi:galactitol-specific phosphotransferase system IIB component
MDFSVESLHAIEKDVETTIAELMNDVDVSSPCDINETKVNETKVHIFTAINHIIKFFVTLDT